MWNDLPADVVTDLTARASKTQLEANHNNFPTRSSENLQHHTPFFFIHGCFSVPYFSWVFIYNLYGLYTTYLIGFRDTPTVLNTCIRSTCTSFEYFKYSIHIAIADQSTSMVLFWMNSLSTTMRLYANTTWAQIFILYMSNVVYIMPWNYFRSIWTCVTNILKLPVLPLEQSTWSCAHYFERHLTIFLF